jgi:D-3-phosphoglycerate dehydrogenase
MSEKFNVYVSRDDRVEHRNYGMGLESLVEDPEVELTFMPKREYHTIRTEDLRGADAVILLKDEITAETLDGLDDLQVVSRFGAGFDGVDIGACTERGIVVTNAPQGVRHSVAQSTVGMLITCASNMRRYDNIVREQGFEGRLENMGVELFGKQLGTIGLGGIGTRVLELLEPFEMDVQTYDPYLPEERADELGVTKVDLDELLETSDFVSLHCPLTDETAGMLGREEFRKMKSTAYFVNTTRGGIYPDEELAEALEADEIAGAAIDVFENEPNVEGNPLLENEDCLVMPHAAGINKDGLARTGRIAAGCVTVVKDGEIPRNVLNLDIYDADVPDEKLSPSYR